MLPRTPAATIEFGSPNACNTCHTDKTPDWADAAVRKWRKRDYQASVLYRASLIQSARDGDWNRLPEILAYLESPENDDIFVASLLRLLRSCNDSSKWKTIMAKLGETSPLVRAAAAEALTPPPGTEAVEHLLKATGDDFRLVRVKAAAALSGIPSRFVPANKHAQLEKADREYVAFLTARPDMWTSHYNLGNYRMQRGEFNEADKAYSIAHELGPRAVPPLVNQSMVKARQGDLPAAQKALLQALKISPANPAVLFNLGLLESELGNSQKAADYLEACLKSDPGQDRAAYNLALLNASANPKKALDFARKALSIQRRPDYAFTVAYLQNSSGDMEGARNRLWKLVDEWPGHGDAYLFLNELLRNSTDREKFKIKLQSAVGSTTIPAAERQRLKSILQNLD
ncbi:MAG TPA: hypothetical protein DCS48_00745 [Desulfovibrio sp.]|nr:hypothetical protein [Desulfovibrio sp.]